MGLSKDWSSITFSWISSACQTVSSSFLPLAPTWVIAVAAFFGILIVAVVLNILRQLVIPRDRSLPPEVFYLLPIVGSAVQYGEDPVNFFLQCREKYGEVFTFVLFGRKVTVALGPKGSDMILGGKPNIVSADQAYNHLTAPVFGPNVVYDCSNDTFMQQKKFVKHGFSTDNLRAYMGMIEEETLNFISKDPAFAATYNASDRSWGSFNSMKSMSELTILTASRTLQGREVRSRLDKTFARRFEDLDGGFTPINFLFPSLPNPSNRRRDKAQREMSQFYQDIISERRERALRGGAEDMEVEHDILAALDQQTYRDGTPLSDVEMAHLMIALLMAGQHTSSSTSAWALLHIAHRVDIQQALYEEQVENFGGPDGKLRKMEYEDLKSLPLLDSVIRETLRMHPPIHSIFRKVLEDLPVPQSLAAPSESGAYVIPKGYFVLTSPLVLGMDPNVWSNPAKWDPYRWMGTGHGATAARKEEILDEKVDYGFGMVSKGTGSPYQPFGAGRHRCIGESFVFVQEGSIIATAVRNMELRLPVGRVVPPHNYHTMIVTPKSPCDIEFRRRGYVI